MVAPTPTGWLIFMASIPRAKALRYMPASLRDAFSNTRKVGAGI